MKNRCFFLLKLLLHLQLFLHLRLEDSVHEFALPAAAFHVNEEPFTMHLVLSPFPLVHRAVRELVCALDSHRVSTEMMVIILPLTRPCCFPFSHSPVYTAPLVYLYTPKPFCLSPAQEPRYSSFPAS